MFQPPEVQIPLCFPCKEEGLTVCLAATAMYQIADSSFSPEVKHELIMNCRIEAEARGCLHKEILDPDYPGRENL